MDASVCTDIGRYSIGGLIHDEAAGFIAGFAEARVGSVDVLVADGMILIAGLISLV